MGSTTQRLYCDVLGGADPSAGLRVTLPPHAGPLTLSFTLHNRQTYSESEVKARPRLRPLHGDAAGRLGHRRGARPGGGAERVPDREGSRRADRRRRRPGGVKAVAPTGAERVVFSVPEGVDEVILAASA